jgi:hypothetical protein
VDGRDKPGHDFWRKWSNMIGTCFREQWGSRFADVVAQRIR